MVNQINQLWEVAHLTLRAYAVTTKSLMAIFLVVHLHRIS
eukprot:Gb_34952 [translate_table: standard]